MKSTFDCSIETNFGYREQMVRAFVYKNYSIEPHQHAFYEINIIQTGSGVHLIEENQFEVRVGDVFVIPPGIVHAYVDCRDMDVYHILVKPQFLQDYTREKETVEGFHLLMEIEPYLRQKCEKNFFLNLSPGELSRLQKDIEIMEEKGAYDFRGCDPLKNAVMVKVLYWLAHLIYVKTYQEEQVGHSLREQTIVAVMEHIHKNYSERITIEELCRIVNVSRPTLMRQFKAFCGCSPIQYLLKYRREMAFTMLENSPLTKTEIAHACGFYDLSHMERVLKDR